MLFCILKKSLNDLYLSYSYAGLSKRMASATFSGTTKMPKVNEFCHFDIGFLSYYRYTMWQTHSIELSISTPKAYHNPAMAGLTLGTYVRTEGALSSLRSN